MIKFICYPRCTTCQKALRWLDDNKIEYELRDIKENNPTFEELSKWYRMSGLELKKFFNNTTDYDLKRILSAFSINIMPKLIPEVTCEK